MGSHVNCYVAGLGETGKCNRVVIVGVDFRTTTDRLPFSADVAQEWFFSGMHSDVLFQVAHLGEAFLADVTDVRTFAGVRTKMNS